MYRRTLQARYCSRVSNLSECISSNSDVFRCLINSSNVTLFVSLFVYQRHCSICISLYRNWNCTIMYFTLFSNKFSCLHDLLKVELSINRINTMITSDVTLASCASTLTILAYNYHFYILQNLHFCNLILILQNSLLIFNRNASQ